MAIYVSVVNFTDQGVKVIRNTVHRADAFRKTAEEMGIEIVGIYWTLGIHDLVIVVDAPDDETVATLFFSVGSLGNIRAHTMRAFSAEEMGRIVDNIP